jgi:DNA-binding CsgD family transcriptional regulator
VVDRLNRLGDVLASNNATLANLELSMHIDRVTCYADGKIIMRTCKLGALPSVLEQVVQEDRPARSPRTSTDDDRAALASLRRRPRLRVDSSGEDGEDVRAALDAASDPDRFAGLDDRWFWEDTFQVPRKKSWAEEHALEVAQLRAEGLTLEKLRDQFGKSVPTIRKAMRYAARMDESVAQLPKKMPPPCWAREHAAEVAELKAQGVSTVEIARRFSKSDTTIRAALKYARQSEGLGAAGDEPGDGLGDGPTAGAA